VDTLSASAYLSGLPFSPDSFQIEAAKAIDRGESVVVSAPTGSGKTVIAEAAIARVLEMGRRAIYTTPLKALSNQKFGDFRARYGAEGVGLLTGDNSINGEAPVVIMTTEVLRNMMYAGSRDLDNVGVAILDEVHYLADRDRGPVWEEIIIHLDGRISLVCLSATIANADEFADWVRRRRGPTSLVVERQRPVPLDSEYLLRDRWDHNRLRMLPVFGDRAGRKPNGRIQAMLRQSQGAGRRYSPPRRTESCLFLDELGLLPAIYFIFSRAGCEAAAAQVVDHGLRLAGPEQAATIREVAARCTDHLSERDLAVLQYGRWVSVLEAGVAAHHAGMVPAFKETVEQLFASGLVKLVFATETLALGINMPARTVVLESLTKFTGEGHELLQPGDYMQLTGRAGRRGIDTLGSAVVLHSSYLPFERVAAIAAAGAHPLRSSFRPTYNMAANLIAGYPEQRAQELLNSSFAQHHEEGLATELKFAIAEEEAGLAADLGAARCELGDVFEFAAASTDSPLEISSALSASTSSGDILEWESGASTVRQVVIARGRGKRPLLLMIAPDATLHRLSPAQLPLDAAVVGRLDLPGPVQPREQAFRREVAARLAAAVLSERSRTSPAAGARGVAACPQLARHLAAVRSSRQRHKRLQALQGRLGVAGAGLVPQLRAITTLLERWGYCRGWALTPAGERLRFIYNGRDLLLAEAIERGLFAQLSAPETAAFASAFTYEPRPGSAEPRWPTRRLETRSATLSDLWDRLSGDEETAGLPITPAPEAGFAEIVYRWATGTELEDLFEDEPGRVGDFVRSCRQLIDLLRQIRDLAGPLTAVAGTALAALDRGVVAAVGAV
jgi:ATP-dependent RNA helicase HelY